MDALIITSYIEHMDEVGIDPEMYDLTVACDAGIVICEQLGIKPDMFVGDYDSLYDTVNKDSKSHDADLTDYEDFRNKAVRYIQTLGGDKVKILELPEEKDVTDTEAALTAVLDEGAESVVVLGGIGGRLDHTVGNIELLGLYCDRFKSISFIDGRNRMTMLMPGEYEIYKNGFRFMSLIPYRGPVEDISIRGVKYPLSHKLLLGENTLGISNEILEDKCSLYFHDGRLLLIQSD